MAKKSFMQMTPEEAFPKRKCPVHGHEAEAGKPLICCMNT